MRPMRAVRARHRGAVLCLNARRGDSLCRLEVAAVFMDALTELAVLAGSVILVLICAWWVMRRP
jgi:hypothetical protein